MVEEEKERLTGREIAICITLSAAVFLLRKKKKKKTALTGSFFFFWIDTSHIDIHVYRTLYSLVFSSLLAICYAAFP